MSRKIHVQLTLDDARKPTGRGGWRPGAGRPKGRTKVGHDRREPVAPSYPQHVTLRFVAGVPSLRQRSLVAIVRDCIARSQNETFRIVHFNVESNHVHLIIEAASNTARATGMKSLESRIGRRINAAVGRSGDLFDARYHARPLKTPNEVRNAIRYVLNNALHHEPMIGDCYGNDWIDPCSSAPWFDGWARPIEPDTDWKRELMALPDPTVKPRTWLLSVGWRRHGPIRFDELPGSRAERRAVASNRGRQTRS